MDQKELSHCAMKLFFGQWKSKTFGDILVTSRRSSGALCEDLNLATENCFELEPFSVDESVEFLKKRTGISSTCDDQDRGEKELAQELGGLPLALEQASAYIRALNCSFELYLQQYRSQKSTLLKLKRAKPHTEIYSEERLAVQTTWLINFSYIENEEEDQELGKAAAFFMKIAAFLPPDEIPLEILNPGVPEIENVDLKKRLEMPVGGEQIVDLLTRFSLFKRKSNNTLSVHRLVQQTLRGHCDGEGETDSVLFSAVRMIHKTFLSCLGGIDFLSDFRHEATWPLQEGEKQSLGATLAYIQIAWAVVPLEAKRWQKLCTSAFHLVYFLLKESGLKPRFFSEESARLFSEAAHYCYSLGMENRGHCYQQFVLEIICAVNKPIRYYKSEDLQKITRILDPHRDSMWLKYKLEKTIGFEEYLSEETEALTDTIKRDELLQAIKVKEPKAREAFSRGEFQTAVDLYTDIVQISNFNPFRGSLRKENQQPHLVPLGKIFCHRGIAHLQMGNLVKAVDDFNTSTFLESELYRAYYWKAYALSKLVESGRTEFTSRAQAATALLHFQFANSKSGDIRKLQTKFPGLLDKIEYKFVSQDRHLKEMERLPLKTDSSNDSVTIILSDGCFHFEEMCLLGGRYYFVCPPGRSATLNCVKGIYLTVGSFMFENIKFLNPHSLDPMRSEKQVEEICESMNLDTFTLGELHRANTEPTNGTGQNRSAFIEADNVHSLVIEHCDIVDQPFTGIAVSYDNSYREKGSVSVRSSKIFGCSRTGLRIQANIPSCHFIIHSNLIQANLYGIVVKSLSHFYIEKNEICGNTLSGVVAFGVVEGMLRKNSIVCNHKHGVFLNRTNAVVEENIISNNDNWGIVCSLESSLQCTGNILENNRCGGLRIMFNGGGDVLVQRCNFRENHGPAVFPANRDEFRQVSVATIAGQPVSLFVSCFLEYQARKCITSKVFKSPKLLDNKVSERSNSPFKLRHNLCCSCHKELERDLIECPNCHIARYCDVRCNARVIAAHHPVCRCILEANKIQGVCKLRMLSKAPQSTMREDHDRKRAGISMCVIATFAVTSGLQLDFKDFDRSSEYQFCLLICPQQNLWTFMGSWILHRLVLECGVHLSERMTDIKAACVLANFDSESGEIAVYRHRVFPLEKVPGALKLVDETLNLLESDWRCKIQQMFEAFDVMFSK